MSSLDCIQGRLSDVVLGRKEPAGLTETIQDDAVIGNKAIQDRIAVYRDTTLLTLTAALKANFPVTVRLVDDRFFAYLADGFIRSNPPSEPRLSHYGAALPDYIARFPACREYRYLADVARLEWAFAQAALERACVALEPQVLFKLLKEGADVRLLLQPSLQFLVLRWSVLPLWEELREHADSSAPPVPLRETTYNILKRDARNVRLQKQGRATFAFRHALADGYSIEQSARVALNRDRFFDLAVELLDLFGEGLVTGISLNANHQ